MAVTTSQEYKELIYDEDSIQEIEITIDGDVVNYDYIKSFKYKDNIFESDFFSLGSIIASQIELECDNDILEDYPDGIEEIEVKFKLLISENNYEVIPFKKYLLKSQSNVKEKYTKFVFQDYIMKFNENGFDFSEFVPLTRYSLLTKICEHYGVELANESIINGDVLVGVYDDSIPTKVWLSSIAERSAGFIKINRNNQLEIKTFNNLDSVTLPNDLVGDFKFNELKTITKVLYENGVPELYEHGTDDGETIFLNSDSPFSCSQTEVDNIYNALNGLQYQTLDCKVWGDPSIDTGDIIIFNGIKSFAQMSWSFGNGFYGSYTTKLEKSDRNNHVERLSSKDMIRRVKSIIDETNAKVTTTISDVNSIESRVLTIEENADSFNIDVVNQKIQNESSQLQSQINKTNGTLEKSNAKISTLEGIITDMNFSFTTSGLNIGTRGIDINSTLNNEGLKIYNLSTLIAIFNKNGAGVDKLIVIKSIQLQNILLKKRQITRSDTNQQITVISGFWLENLIEDLHSLEV